MSTTAKKLGQRIRLLRERKDLTQEQLAEKADTTCQYISSLERGLQNVTLLMLEKIADSLQTELFTLFSFDSKNEKISKQSLKRLIDDIDDNSVDKVGKIIRNLFG